MDHAAMRMLIREAFRRRFGREATTSEAQCAQAIAALETQYGAGWKPPGNGSWNFGAQQAGSGWTGETFSYTDTNPNADGTSTPYFAKFRKYPNAIEGADDFIRIVFQANGRDKKVLPAATAGNTLGFSTGLHETGYYAGFGATVEERIAHHHAAVVRSIRTQASQLHESLPADIAALPRTRETLRVGATGLDVETLQAALNAHGTTPQLVADGSFGSKTAAALKKFQGNHGLIADGVCGPATWAALEPRHDTDPAGPPDEAA